MSGDRPFRITRMFHPTQHTPSLSASEEFFRRFFHRESHWAEPVLKKVLPPDSTYPTDYCIFTPMRDVFFDSVDPKRYVLDGIQPYQTVEAPVLRTTGWYAQGMAELFAHLTQAGFTLIDTKETRLTDYANLAAAAVGQPMFFTSPDETGIRYQFFQDAPFYFDVRSQGDWTLPPVDVDCPFGLEFCAFHTILTANPDRAMRLLVDVLGGTIIDRSRNEAIGARSTYVALADAVFEFAIPDPGTRESTCLAASGPLDSYHSLTWKVGDLARVEAHLAAIGVPIRNRTADTIIVDPAHGHGIAWGFTTRTVPGDLRAP